MRLNQTTLIALVTFSLVAAASACKKEEAEPTPATPEATPIAEAPAPKPADTEPAAAKTAEQEPAEAALAEYETVRAALAEDDIAAAVNAAPKLQEKAASAAGVAKDERRPHFEALAKAAEELATSAPDDAAAARNAFGEASRAVVALLAEAPELREGRHVFECPMAKGFKKWVQSDEQLANPYMGQKMLTCGGGSEWEVGS